MTFDIKTYQKEYYKNNREKLIERMRKFNEENKEHIKKYQRDYHKQYYQENKNKLAKQARERYRIQKYGAHLAKINN